VPEGMRDNLDIEVGDDNLKLCLDNSGHCFKARVVVLASKFPGFGKFTKYGYINHIHPPIVVT
jgi:hypothetical protein